MSTWEVFEREAPELAKFGMSRLVGRIAYLATIRPDGSPRVHPFSPILGLGGLFVYMEPTSPKGHDLRRDPRYALHCAVEDNEGGGGEFAVSGRARLIDDSARRAEVFDLARRTAYTPHERYILFELEIDQALGTVYDSGGIRRTRWP